jgi:hypothetical protein
VRQWRKCTEDQNAYGFGREQTAPKTNKRRTVEREREREREGKSDGDDKYKQREREGDCV